MKAVRTILLITAAVLFMQCDGAYENYSMKKQLWQAGLTYKN
jgi:hypothetical protein